MQDRSEFSDALASAMHWKPQQAHIMKRRIEAKSQSAPAKTRVNSVARVAW